MDSTLLVLALGAVLVALDFVLHRSHLARRTFATLAGKIPRWFIWMMFLFAIGAAAHIASIWAMLALVVAIGVFGFVMLAWLAAADGR
jgi:hypothetical protein